MSEPQNNMPDVKDYLDLVEHDLKLLDLLTNTPPSHLANEDFSDWKVTVLFYMACIYLKAVCHSLGVDVPNHYALRQTINTRGEIWLIATDYRHLEEASQDARYEGRKFTSDYIKQRLLPKFNNVRDCAVNLLREKDVPNVPSVESGPLLERAIS